MFRFNVYVAKLLIALTMLLTTAACWAQEAKDDRLTFSRITLPIERHAHSVIADDIDGDGQIDLVVAAAGANSVAVFKGEGNGKFAAPVYWPVGKTPKFAMTGDFNHDGHRDIVTADQDSKTISILLGNGDGTFRPAASYPACNGDHEVAVADFNRDGNDDVVVACHGKPYFASVFLGTGDGTFRPQLQLFPGGEPAAVAVADFNRDGIPDLAFANRVDDAVAVLLGNGDGTFKNPMAFATGKSPHAVRAGDVNGDGIQDLVTANDSGNTVTILYGTGDGGFTGRVDLPANNFPKSVAIADVNGDGRSDVVVTNTTYPNCCTVAGSTISVILNLGDGRFMRRQDFDAGGNPFSLLVRDLNGDGKIDIATANFIDQTPAQHIYLQALQVSGLPSKVFKALAMFAAILMGLLVFVASRQSFKSASIVVGVIVAVTLAASIFVISRQQQSGDSHLSILLGR